MEGRRAVPGDLRQPGVRRQAPAAPCVRRRAASTAPGPTVARSSDRATGPLTDVRRAAAALGDPELDPELLERALTHRSFAYENGGLPTNERLEFLGDSVLGVVVTETLYRTHPDLSEGRLAKLRAAVVNARALAEVARTIGLGEHVKLGRGEESTGGRDKASILSDTVEAVIGAIYLSAGFEQSAQVVHLLFDPLMEAAARMGAGLDWKTSLQELSALHGLGVPEYVIEDDRPRPHEDLHRAGPGRRPAPRPRRRPLQEGSRAAGRRDGVPRDREAALEALPCRARHARRRAPPATTDACPSSPRSRSSAAASSATCVGRPITPVEVLHPRPVRRDPRGPTGFAAALTGRTSRPPAAAASTSGSPSTTATPCSATSA